LAADCPYKRSFQQFTEFKNRYGHFHTHPRYLFLSPLKTLRMPAAEALRALAAVIALSQIVLVPSLCTCITGKFLFSLTIRLSCCLYEYIYFFFTILPLP
jgi:hypothetical protein